MITIRRSNERGHANHGWLDTYHSFSFGSYYDPKNMGFRSLRVINEDRVAGGQGFPTHPHADMEIVTYVLEGSLAHKDSTGAGGTIKPGELQRISAGSGLTHSEANHSKTDPVHFLQIWITPDKRGHTPSYQQKSFDLEGGTTRGGARKLALLASPAGESGSLKINQDVQLFGGRLAKAQEVTHEIAPGRAAWVQVARGKLNVNGKELSAGDGAAITDERKLAITAKGDAEVLLFDLA